MRYLALIMFLVPASAFAASLTFVPQGDAGVGAPLEIALEAQSDTAINAVAVSLTLPESLAFVEVSDGNSVIPLWVDQPAYDEATRTLSFAGILPNGFSGRGRLLTLVVEPVAEGAATLVLSRDSHAYEEEGQRVPLLSTPLALAVSGRGTLTPSAPDTDPPEAFVPVIARDQSLHDGKAVLIFSTVDKGSGIRTYLVKESWLGNLFPASGWKEVQSPHVLADQLRSSYVYVRAVDKAGNAFEASLPPAFPLPVYIVPLVLVIMLASLIYARTKR